MVVTEKRLFNEPTLCSPTKLHQVNSEKGRYYTVDESPVKYYSITTVLSKTADNNGLKEWRERIGYKEADKISKAATSLGTKLHKLMEHFLDNTWTPNISPELNFRFQCIKGFLEMNVYELLGSELPVYSRAMGVAGTIDLVFKNTNGEIIIADLKTAKAPKHSDYYQDYFLQIAAYSLCLYEQYQLVADKGLILFSYPEGSSPVWFKQTDYCELFCHRLNKFHNVLASQENKCASL